MNKINELVERIKDRMDIELEGSYSGYFIKNIADSDSIAIKSKSNQYHIAITGEEKAMLLFPVVTSSKYEKLTEDGETAQSEKSRYIFRSRVRLSIRNLIKLCQYCETTKEHDLKFESDYYQNEIRRLKQKTAPWVDSYTSIKFRKDTTEKHQRQIELGTSKDDQDFICFRKCLCPNHKLLILKHKNLAEYDMIGIEDPEVLTGIEQIILPDDEDNNIISTTEKGVTSSSGFGGGENAGINKIFFGPPGTGKSHRANELIGKKDRISTLFHPEYTYGDFVGTYRPVVGEHPSDKIKDTRGNEIPAPINYFGFVPGPFMQAIAKAISNLNEDLENPSPVFLLIDEINRGDCSSIFGDIFQLLDRDEKGNSQYGVFIKPEIKEWIESEVGTGTWDFMGNGDLNIPHNLSIIGTMNTSDQNLYPMDTAFKRRWEWQSCSVEKEYETFQEYCQDPYLEIDGVKYDWIKLIKKLNDHITNQHNMEDKQIGPWFIRPNNDGSIDQASFANKLLFYLWHDVFKDEQGSQSSPFLDGDQISTFGKLQDTFETGGLEAIFKKEVLPDGLGSSPESAGESNPIRSDDLSEEPESPGE